MTQELDDRRKKLDALRAIGVDPWGRRFDGAEPIADIVKRVTAEPAGRAVAAGRLMTRRDMGKAAFFDLRDETGKIQVYVRQDKLAPEHFKLFGLLDLGDWVGITGAPGKTRTGEPTIFADGLTLLCKSLRPLPEKFHGLKDPELRYRRRYLDLIANPDVRETFLRRSKIVASMRQFLNGRGYVEVETPTLITHPGGAAARPFVTHHNALDMDLHLRIALEIPLKKLMVGGIPRVYEIGRVFRNEGIDATHSPEFTMLELYHAFGDLRTMMELVESLVARLATEIHGGTKVPWEGRELSVTPPWPRRDYMELFREHVPPSLADAKNMTRIDELFGEYVEPKLQDAVFVTGQPIEMTPLCRELAEKPGVADRFESYLAGAELSNAYTELNDPVEQRRRLEAQAGGDASKIDEDFLLALEHAMPPAGGMGMGIDRLVRILTGQHSIREVILFPLLREGGQDV